MVPRLLGCVSWHRQRSFLRQVCAPSKDCAAAHSVRAPCPSNSDSVSLGNPFGSDSYPGSHDVSAPAKRRPQSPYRQGANASLLSSCRPQTTASAMLCSTVNQAKSLTAGAQGARSGQAIPELR